MPVLEALDQAGLLGALLPEWELVRSRPQRNSYHRFTVDRHLVEAAAAAAALTSRVSHPDLLLLGALLHDLGKGQPGDHTANGVELVGRIGPRLGLPAADVEVLTALVCHHLLLPDVATRRDLADPATATTLARAVGTGTMLELLHALTEADALATGAAAWSGWKAGLVAPSSSAPAGCSPGSRRPRRRRSRPGRRTSSAAAPSPWRPAATRSRWSPRTSRGCWRWPPGCSPCTGSTCGRRGRRPAAAPS